MKYEKQRIAPLLFTVYSAAASGRSPALPCFAAFLVLVRFSGLFAFTQFIFQTRIFREQKAYQEQLAEALGDSFAHPEMVFTSANGNYRDRSALRTSFKRFLKGTEFEFLTLHQLRHCNATLLLNSGIDLKIVSEHLGHCDIGVTANIYADVLKSTKAKVADLVSLKLA